MNSGGGADCSSFVWAGYAELGLSESLGWQKWGSGWCVNTANMYDTFVWCQLQNKHGKRLWGLGRDRASCPNGGQLSKMLADHGARRHPAPSPECAPLFIRSGTSPTSWTVEQVLPDT